MNGKVYLVGAGPGDIGLITVRGFDLLKVADVVLYDSLANDDLLNYCRKETELIFAGKEAGLHHVTQEDTIAILIEKAKQGKNIVRLKGGDPLVFGRGSEEALALKEAGIEFEIIPGVTAAIGATAYAGIPLTHRGIVTQCIFVTAHETPDKQENQVEWEKLAQMKAATIVIYMGAKMLPKIVETLISYGMNKDTKTAVIENGTLPNQKTLFSPLHQLPQKVKEVGFKPPLITIIGPTVDFSNELNWFEKKPLFGKRIVVTRSSEQADKLNKLLRDEGAQVISFPVIRTELIKPDTKLKDLLNENFDWLIFSSENGVRWFFELMKLKGLDSRVLGGIKIAVIGTGTAAKLSEFGLIADFVPTQFSSEDMIKELSAKFDLTDKNILRIKGYFKNDPLTDGLRAKGANVETLEVYTLEKEIPDSDSIQDLKKNGADSVLFTSSSTVENFFEILGKDTALQVLNNAKAVAIGPVTSETLKQMGVTNYLIAEKYNLDGLLDVLKAHFVR
jgi:uroporphyrinogen III methyltransferase / synthase